MRRTTSEFKTEFTVEPFVAVAVAAIENSMRGVDLDHPASADVLAHGVMQALDVAGFAIVRKPHPISTAASRIEFARRTGNWASVSDKDYRNWVQSLAPDAFVLGTVSELTREGEDAIARFQSMTLVPGNTLELPPGTEIRSVDTAAPEPERDYSGLRENSADDLAARYGCWVTLTGMDDADTPLTDEGIVGDPQYVVVTERATGRHVALVEAWETEDGDPIVPKRWLEVVLGAWDAARDPQQGA